MKMSMSNKGDRLEAAMRAGRLLGGLSTIQGSLKLICEEAAELKAQGVLSESDCDSLQGLSRRFGKLPDSEEMECLVRSLQPVVQQLRKSSPGLRIETGHQ